jgi:glutathione synthase/RimK-type ligase-like ATP-grasp enzyme
VIFIWGIPGDCQIAVVLDALSRLRAPFFFFNQHELPNARIELDVGSQIGGTLCVGKRQLNLAEVTAAYLRPYDSGRIPSVAKEGPSSTTYKRAREIEDALLSWAEITPALVVNRPSDMAWNGSKPHQAIRIQSFGWKVPPTLITTDPKDVKGFLSQEGQLIYKSISGVRSIVSRLCKDELKRLDNIKWCPTQFQKYVPGQDFRVHVIGKQVFAACIESSADDYRYASRQKGKTRIRPAEIPADLPIDIAARCRRMALCMQLWVAGIDLRRTKDGHWYCFEVNPSPGFTYFQEDGHPPMDAAIARLLIAGKSAVLGAD